MVNASILDYEVDSVAYNDYEVTFHATGATIDTLVTTSSDTIDDWLAETTHSGESLIVGLGAEWRPNFSRRRRENLVATLQLCVDERCLIVQLLHTDEPLPPSLFAFLDNPVHSFVGVGIAGDAEKLLRDYDLEVANAVDLRTLAARTFGDRRLRSEGLRGLAWHVAGLDIEKPRRVTLGRWDHRWLNSEQIMYACIDAYASYLIGESLINCY